MLNPRIIPLLLVGIALPVLGCGGPGSPEPGSPEDVVKEVTYASRDGDLDKLERLVTPDHFRNMLQPLDGGNREQLAQSMRHGYEQMQFEDLRIVSTQIDGDSATVEVALVTGQGEVRYPTYLRKIRGEWRVTSPPASRGARRGRR